MMLISSAVAQAEGGGIDWIWIIALIIFFMMAGRRDEKTVDSRTISESWYTIQDIKSTYASIESKATEWRKYAKERKSTSDSLMSKLKGVFIKNRSVERYVEKETKPPRLYRMNDSTGPIYFELTEVEGGGTVVKTMYSPDIKIQMAKFKVELPLKIPAMPIGLHCQTCGKPILSEFVLCPYCGEKLINE